MCLYRVMTHCAGFFLPSRNRARCVSTSWTGSSSTQTSSPSPSSFILGSGPLSSATPETPSKITYKHTHKCRPPIRVPSLRPLCCLLSFPESSFAGALPGRCDGRVFHVKEEGRCENVGGEQKYEKTSGVTFSHALSRVPGFPLGASACGSCCGFL